jgi:hypothetical protein
MSRGLGRWQRAALAVLDQELQFREIAARLDAVTWSQRSALRRALDRLVAVGQLGKRPGKRMYGGPRDIVWFHARRGPS